jgi:hypothetical protein
MFKEPAWKETIMSTIFSGNGQDHGSTSTLINMVITDSVNLVQMSVVTHKVGVLFHGNYNPTLLSAAVFVAQADFAALKAQLANGATIPISITVDQNNAITQFCFATTCVSATAGLNAAIEALASISGLSPNSGPGAATGTD